MQRMNIRDSQYTERLAAGKIRCQRNCSTVIIVKQQKLILFPAYCSYILTLYIAHFYPYCAHVEFI
jgi:hypothetical protein